MLTRIVAKYAIPIPAQSSPVTQLAGVNRFRFMALPSRPSPFPALGTALPHQAEAYPANRAPFGDAGYPPEFAWRVWLADNHSMSATAKKVNRRRGATSGAGVTVTPRKADGRFTKGGTARHVLEKSRGEPQAARRSKPAARPAAAEKSADAAARRRIAATLDLDAHAATQPANAPATATHWATPD
jgi:hypothetical protein